MFSTGFALYLDIVALAPEVPPVTTSFSNLLFADIKILLVAVISSPKIVAVAPESAPVIVSPSVNFPVVVDSAATLSPAFSCVIPCEWVPSNKR